jgi:hypothetical protein
LLRHLGGLGRKLEFYLAYRENRWGDSESRSGIGSRRDSGSVQHSLKMLEYLTALLQLTSIADIPCGDFNWIHAYLERHPDVSYVGYDIVRSLVSRNRRLFAPVRFELLDIVSTVPARADLIFCKDLLNHLEDHEIGRAIANMQLSGSTWLLASNNFDYPNVPLRRDRYRDTRHVDLAAAPFGYPQPAWHDHYLGLWRLSDMQGVAVQRPLTKPA